jgi:hypothetical protein
MRTPVLTQDRIDELIAEAKSVPEGLSQSPLQQMKQHHQYLRKDFKIQTTAGNEFIVILRQSTRDVFDFSAILGYQLPGFNTIFRLKRYNGRHTHSNSIEKTKINHGFHIHTATERYQKVSLKEESFAEETDRYTNLSGAVQCLLQDCGFRDPVDNSPLFKQPQ